ncbi:hypothetical protein [Clostridium lacusfryxellense]|uniref:hypothetical protein n=1 Tax=Clostridium lacusfryxellense TaxID=205328 RepID=UPI001C0CB633|nr:hypothetical protein [Clostridium lacusfryxellense]MBU3110229.1 hypothetical protein [Clostridium lacusfryxellense]
MNISVFTIYKIEIFKLIKRKDWLALLALVAISLLLGVAVLSKSYKGPINQSALFWTSSQIINSTSLFITPMIFAFIGSRILASEIEDGSILLYTIRFRNRMKIYLGKSLAIISFATIAFLMDFIINIAIYYVFVCQNPSIGTGKFLGINTLSLVIVTLALYVATFILIAQFSLFLGAFFKPAAVIGIIFATALVVMNTTKVPYFRNLNPMYYVVRINDVVLDKTSQIVVNYSEKLNLFFLLVLLSVIYIIIFNILAVKKLEKSDL